MSNARWVDESSPIRSEILSEDEVVLQIGDQKFVMSFDAVYDLAFRFAHLVNEMSARQESERVLQ